MANFFKGLAKGLLYVLFFPFGIVAILLYGVFGIFVFVFQFFKLIFLFFTGRNLQSDLPEDIEVKKIIEMKSGKVEEEKKDLSMSLYPSDSIVYGGGYVSPVTEDKEEASNDEKSDDEVEREGEEDA